MSSVYAAGGAKTGLWRLSDVYLVKALDVRTSERMVRALISCHYKFLFYETGEPTNKAARRSRSSSVCGCSVVRELRVYMAGS